jgi:hypothetical protein
MKKISGRGIHRSIRRVRADRRRHLVSTARKSQELVAGNETDPASARTAPRLESPLRSQECSRPKRRDCAIQFPERSTMTNMRDLKPGRTQFFAKLVEITTGQFEAFKAERHDDFIRLQNELEETVSAEGHVLEAMRQHIADHGWH